jgi:hypothetical protein
LSFASVMLLLFASAYKNAITPSNTT